MKKLFAAVHSVIMKYLKFGWPIVLADAAFETWGGPGSRGALRDTINSLAFGWILCAPLFPLSLLLNRDRRERAMARLCGLREGDERERAVTGEAARSAFLLGLSLQTILLVMSLISVRLYWKPIVPAGEKHGILSVGMAFSSQRHLDPFGTAGEDPKFVTLGAPPEFQTGEHKIAGGFLLAPSMFSVLALLILAQLAAFKAYSTRRYAGAD